MCLVSEVKALLWEWSFNLWNLMLSPGVCVCACVCVCMHACTRTHASHSVVSDSLPPHGLQPAKLLCLWNSPGKNTGVGCHSLLHGRLYQKMSYILEHPVGVYWELKNYLVLGKKIAPCLVAKSKVLSMEGKNTPTFPFKVFPVTVQLYFFRHRKSAAQ